MKTIGADIHPYLEMKADGKWKYVGLLRRDRCYALFSKLSGVRGGDEPFFPMPNSLPIDCSEEIVREFIDADDKKSPSISYNFHSLTIVDYSELISFNEENPDYYTEDWEKIMRALHKAFDCDMRVIIGYDS